jgi:hypothetical protein
MREEGFAESRIGWRSLAQTREEGLADLAALTVERRNRAVCEKGQRFE